MSQQYLPASFGSALRMTSSATHPSCFISYFSLARRTVDPFFQDVEILGEASTQRNATVSPSAFSVSLSSSLKRVGVAETHNQCTGEHKGGGGEIKPQAQTTHKRMRITSNKYLQTCRKTPIRASQGCSWLGEEASNAELFCTKNIRISERRGD